VKIANDDAVVKEWLMMIKVACDPASPFAGMVDISGLMKLPLPTQKRIFDAMTVEERGHMKALYGPKDGVTP
jgi:hypothetical protein